MAVASMVEKQCRRWCASSGSDGASDGEVRWRAATERTVVSNGGHVNCRSMGSESRSGDDCMVVVFVLMVAKQRRWWCDQQREEWSE